MLEIKETENTAFNQSMDDLICNQDSTPGGTNCPCLDSIQ